MVCCLCFDGSPVDDHKYAMHERQWETDMCGACCANPCACLVAMVAPCCCACHVRKMALNHDLQKYQCCQRHVCSSCTEKCCGCCENSCPCLTLCAEGLFCPCWAISSTRMYVQEERQLMNDPCDNRLIRLNNCLQCLACVCHCFKLDGEQAVQCIADIVFLVVSGCMQAQVHHELRRHPTVADYGESASLMRSAPQ
mmetsp:Transcript_17019/g.44329  ORF Transcript_17019/g.44329 Transcript_17019/m.44329 type:complete len:197 (-) Transcript_17019:60-650(-)